MRGVYERSDANERTKEGLPKVKGFIGEEFDTNVEIKENGVRYLVDVVNGQKTGFFLDQKYNRLAMQRICKGKKVLDCFTHMGTFALNAGIAGAARGECDAQADRAHGREYALERGCLCQLTHGHHTSGKP